MCEIITLQSFLERDLPQSYSIFQHLFSTLLDEKNQSLMEFQEWPTFLSSLCLCHVALLPRDMQMDAAGGIAASLFRIKSYAPHTDVCVVLVLEKDTSIAHAFACDADGKLQSVATLVSPVVFDTNPNVECEIWLQTFDSLLRKKNASFKVRVAVAVAHGPTRDLYHNPQTPFALKVSLHNALMTFVEPVVRVWPGALRPRLCVFQAHNTQVSDENDTCRELWKTMGPKNTDIILPSMCTRDDLHISTLFGRYYETCRDPHTFAKTFAKDCALRPPRVECNTFVRAVTSTLALGCVPVIPILCL